MTHIVPADTDGFDQLALPSVITVPETIDDTVAVLNGVMGISNAMDWGVALIVWAHVDPSEGQGSTSVNNDRGLSAKAFARLGIRGLKSHNSVLKYWNGWDDAITRGIAQPAIRGEPATIPTEDFTTPKTTTDGDEWYTPPWLFDALGIRYSIDVCAPTDPDLRTAPADSFYTIETDGLTQDWYGTVWCNPPYSKPEGWAAKLIGHGDGLLLTHIPMNAEWASDVWQTCDGIRLFQAMQFLRADGELERPGYWLQLAAFGDKALDALTGLVTPPDVAENPRRIPSPLWTT